MKPETPEDGTQGWEELWTAGSQAAAATSSPGPLYVPRALMG